MPEAGRGLGGVAAEKVAGGSTVARSAQHNRGSQKAGTVLVQVYASGAVMGVPLPRPAALAAQLETSVEHWPYLDEGTLLKTRSRKVCMTCHWFRHHAGVNCIPVLTCQLHQGLIAHGEHLTSRCQGWTDDMTRRKGWAPEVA